jgi:hypothetical protein
MISITAQGHHCSSVSQDDIWRAQEAAQKVFDAAGLSASDACSAYMAQWRDFDDEDPMTGAARTWIEARQAADVALTETWADSGAEVFCEMSA